MRRPILFVFVALATSAAAGRLPGQPYESRSMGFYAGAALETDVINVKTNDSPTQWGGGGALLAGYGFTKRWSAYAQLSGARMSSSGADPAVSRDYTLAHLDVGVRVHFRAPQRMLSPFAQVALSGRRVSNTVNGQDVSNSGGGLTAGGGFNAFLTGSVAFTASANVTIGTFNRFDVNGTSLLVPSASIGANTFRVSIGATWFPLPNPPPRTVRGSLK